MTDALAAWLARLEKRTPEARIHLGLERVRAVLDRLPSAIPNCPVITVGGTNGKGSVVALLESMYRAGGYRTLAYTSPHLVHFTERIRINAAPVDLASLIDALDLVERQRDGLDLTYFEHVTLAALVVAARSKPDVVLLEVGLGGRLDAVNVIDPDVSVITSIDLDHVEWLGRTRSAIAREKGGIARSGRPLIIGEPQPPRGWLADLERGGAMVRAVGRDFSWQREDNVLRLTIGEEILTLPEPALAGSWQAGNAASAVMAVRALNPRLPVAVADMAAGLKSVVLPGRLQCLGGRPEIWADVAHNVAAARTLAGALAAVEGRTIAVFSALAGKDVSGMARVVKDHFEHWLVPELAGDRSRSADEIAELLRELPVAGSVETVESVSDAVRSALAQASPDDRIVVFGSFRIVAEAWSAIQQRE